MSKSRLNPEPVSRNLRIFAFDPSVTAQLDTAGIGEITVSVPWEHKLEPGPIGEYVEVVDVDPASGVVYKPVDLNDEWLLAQNGLPPSESNPQFHQQMVYAVAMTTIGHFEQALGRVALWSSHRLPDSFEQRFVRRLRIYPHALRDRNAYYSPTKKALLFGYFPVGIKDANNAPGTLVYTCLSHDIVAHETTHALLDGVHPRFNEPVNADVLAFHEAFADIVALFQHFSYSRVLRDQIARTRGNLAGDNLLGQLAQQFGRASGRARALRDYLGGVNSKTGKWEAATPDVRALDRTLEPHDRGAILVAAVFGAFLKVYRTRTMDLYRIASDGTGVLREGEIHPDLADRLAAEAARAAQQTLQMCIRAIDYCAPVGITFGDYLRAIVTADYDLNAQDTSGHRLAFVESFQQWGIHPSNMLSMSVDALLWPSGAEAEEQAAVGPDRVEVKSLFNEPQKFNLREYQASQAREAFTEASGRAVGNWYQRAKAASAAAAARRTRPAAATPRRAATSAEDSSEDIALKPWGLDTDRYETWRGIDQNAKVLWSWLIGRGRKLAPAIGIVLDEHNPPPSVFRSEHSQNRVAVEVHAVRWAARRGRRGGLVPDLVVEFTQRRRGYFDRKQQAQADAPGSIPTDDGDFIYRAGCTLLINPVTMEVRRVVATSGNIADNDELERMRRFLTEGGLDRTMHSISLATCSRA